MTSESDIVQAMVAAALPSPQPVTGDAVLFLLRVTGTGFAHREGAGESVYRLPQEFLTSEFLDQCSGVPVVWDHPRSGTLTSDDFGQTVIGTVVRPFIKDGEVWCVGKIRDRDAIDAMTGGTLSTSPSVILKPGDAVKVAGADGKPLMIEGRPSVVDHLAVCERGVWDRGSSGIRVDSVQSKKDNEMPDDTKPADDLAAYGQKIDTMLSHQDKITGMCDSIAKACDALSQRMDSLEKAGAKKAEDDGNMPAPVMDDAESAGMKFGRTSPTPQQRAEAEDKDHAEAISHQAKADSVYQALGLRGAPAPLHRENPTSYRRRLIAGVKKYSPEFREADLSAVKDAALLAGIESRVYADAMKASETPTLPASGFRMITRTNPDNGVRMNEFHGPKTIFSMLGTPAQRVTRIGLPRDYVA